MRGIQLILLAAAELAASSHAIAADFSYTGTFAQDDEKREFFFTLSQSGNVLIRTFSYAGGTNAAGTVIPAGGFDPTITLYDGSGGTIIFNRDGGCGTVATDPATRSCWDAYVSAALPAGNYRVLLTQSDNLPAGPLLTDSFLFDGQGNFTQAPSGGAPGFWDYYPSKRTGAFAIDIRGVNAAVLPAVTSSATLPAGIRGIAYTPVTLTAQGGANYTWTVMAGGGTTGLPPGMTLTAAGKVQGTPTTSGIYTFIAQADDGVQPVQQTVTLPVYDPVQITTLTLPGGAANQAYGPVQLTAMGGSGNFAWSSTNLPGGLVVSASGKISGIPSAGGTFAGIVIQLADTAAGQSASKTYTISVGFPPLLISGPGVLPGVSVGTALNVTYVASGGNPPYSWTGTNLPPGLSLSAGTGVLSGTAAQPGNFAFTIQVNDASSRINALGGSLSVLGIVTSSLPGATTTGAYSQQIQAAGGVMPYTFTATGVPAGLTLSGSGLLAGNVKASGNYPIVFRVTDAGGAAAMASFTLTVTGPSPLTVLDGPLSSGTPGTAYADSVKAVGGKAPYTWVVTGGTLPGGLTFGSDGAVSGVPGAVGTSTFTAQATDSANATASGVISITITSMPLTLLSGTLPAGVVGIDYPLQILPASGGSGPYNFAITSGSLPGGLTLASGQISGIPTAAGTFTIVVTVTDSGIPAKTATANYGILIRPSQADLILSSTSLPFSLMTGAVGLPTPGNVTVRSSVIQTLLNYSVTVTPAVTWLNVTGGGTTPGTIVAALDPRALNLASSPNPYTTSIVVTCNAPSPCAGSSQNIAVAVTVSAPPPQLTFTSKLLSFTSSPMNPVPPPQALGVQNSGSGILGIRSVTTGAPWLSVSGLAGTIPSGPAVPATVTVDPGGLRPGFYRSSITVMSSAGPATVPVDLLVSPNTTLSLAPAGTQFRMPAGNPPANPAGSFLVSVMGTATVNWTAAVQAGASWLSVTSPVGVATSAVPGVVNFAVDAAVASSLPVKTYYGTITVTSADAVNSPLDFRVVLDIQPPQTPVVPDVQPAGIQTSFVAGSGGSQKVDVRVFASSPAPVPYQASVTTADGGNWLSVTPATGTSSAGEPGVSSIAFTPGALPAGTYRGGVSYAFPSAAVRTVNITMIVTDGAAAQTLVSAATAACTPTKLVATQTGLVSNFAQPTAWPTPLTIRLSNDCGLAVAQGQVVATFSNGDAPLPLASVDSASGTYAATWTPRTTSAQVTIQARATATGYPSATTQITGVVTANAAPVLTPNGTLHVFNPLVGGSIGPGNIAQIYGANLSAQATVSSALPLSTQLGGTQVLIGGIPAPLYYVSPGQINAQIPFELVAGKQYQVVISANGALTTPETVQLTAVSPGIAAFPGGQIIAQHLDGSLVSQTSPGKPGEFIIFYLAGLGLTDNPVVTGAASPASPLARPVTAPTLTLNGVSQPFQFVGLTPGIVSLYQINFLIPEGTPDGDLPLVVSQAGVASNQVILPVRH
jgi:uncharacterized protein (TIGR03437 family)